MSYHFSLKNLLTAMILLVASLSYAQSDIGITLNITPPYSTKFSEYVETPGKVLLIVRNNTNQVKNIYLRGSVTGDNGISMYNEANVKPSTPVTLQPFQVYNANNNYLQELFSVAKYKMIGITPVDLLNKNGLPEGNYNICIRAYDYNTNAPLSGDAPQGCKMLTMANLEPPYPLKPMADEEVKGMEPQNVIFTWTVPAGAEPGTQYKLRVIEMLNPAKNINDAMNSATTPTFFETTVSANVFVFGPAQPKLVLGRKYAWAVTAIPGPKKIAYKNNGRSEVRSFVFGKEPAKPTGPVITLLKPADKEEFSAIGGMNTPIALKWDYTNPSNQFFMEDALVFEVKEGQTPEQAIKMKQRVNSSKEPQKSSAFGGSSFDGKRFAWFVTLNDNGKIYTSEVRTFSIGISNVAGQEIKDFEFGGYQVKVNSITDKGGFQYSGSGTTPLYKGGPLVTFSFEDITIKPFFKKSNGDFINWRVVNGSAKSKKLYKTFIKYTMPKDIDGNLRFQADYLVLSAAMHTKNNQDGSFSEGNIYGDHGSKIEGTFIWETDYLYKAENGLEKTAIYTGKVNTKFDFYNQFSEIEDFYLLLQTPDGYNTMKLSVPATTTLKLAPTLHITQKGTTPKFSFDGYFEIPQLKNGKPGITVNFSKKTSMTFTQAINYSVPVTNDNSVIASFDKVDMNIGFGAYIKIPQLNMKFTYDGKAQSFNFTKGFFTVNNGLYCKETKLVTGDINMAGFPVTLSESVISLVNSKLFELKIAGSFEVPFIKQNGELEFYATEEGIQQAAVYFDFDKTTILYQNIAGDKCELSPYSGVFKSDRIVMNGTISFSNNTSANKNFTIKDLSLPEFYIKANGDVGIMNGTLAGGTVPYQVAGSYNGFKFTPCEVNLSKASGGNYRITMNGLLVLADNLSSDTKYPNFTTNVVFDASQIKGGGPPPNQEVSFSSTKVQGGLHDGSVDFGTKFELFVDDPVFGNGFMSEDNFGIQQPEPMQVHAKMIIAKAPGGYNYWFFEAGQENVMQIPTGVLDLGIYGFTGRVYYKMNHTGSNINSDDYVPDNDKFIGIYGLTKLKTLTDNGVKFWGDVSFEVLTNNSGLESIKFRGGGEFVSPGLGSKGMIGAHDCQLNFCWAPKQIYGEFNITGSFAGAITIDVNSGFDITPDYFHLWGGGTAYLFGSTTFKCGDFGMDLTQDNINVWGNYYLVDISKGFNFAICKPSVTLKSGLYLDAYVNYSPFQFKGMGSLYGSLRVAGCKLKKTFKIGLDAQVMFPSPTCVSAGINISTPLKDFKLSAGIKNGGIFWGSCF